MADEDIFSNLEDCEQLDDKKNIVSCLVDHTPIFTLGDSSINDRFLTQGKGPHLIKAGLNKVGQEPYIECQNRCH